MTFSAPLGNYFMEPRETFGTKGMETDFISSSAWLLHIYNILTCDAVPHYFHVKMSSITS